VCVCVSAVTCVCVYTLTPPMVEYVLHEGEDELRAVESVRQTLVHSALESVTVCD